VPWSSIERMAASIRGSRPVKAQDAGHMIPLEQPDWLAGRITEFHARI